MSNFDIKALLLPAGSALLAGAIMYHKESSDAQTKVPPEKPNMSKVLAIAVATGVVTHLVDDTPKEGTSRRCDRPGSAAGC